MEPTPSQPPNDADLRARAVHRLRQQRAYRFHRSVYLLVIALLVAIWLATAIPVGGGAWFPWPVFPLVGWGIGLFFHRRAVYGTGITEADIEREINRLRGDRSR